MIEKLEKKLDEYRYIYKPTGIDSKQFEKNVRVSYAIDILTHHLKLLEFYENLVGSEIDLIENKFLGNIYKGEILLLTKEEYLNIQNIIVDVHVKECNRCFEKGLFMKIENELDVLINKWITETAKDLFEFYRTLKN